MSAALKNWKIMSTKFGQGVEDAFKKIVVYYNSPNETDKAKLRLISAAPELLETAREALKLLSFVTHFPVDVNPQPTITMLKEAIAKAVGDDDA